MFILTKIKSLQLGKNSDGWSHFFSMIPCWSLFWTVDRMSWFRILGDRCGPVVYVCWTLWLLRALLSPWALLSSRARVGSPWRAERQCRHSWSNSQFRSHPLACTERTKNIYKKRNTIDEKNNYITKFIVASFFHMLIVWKNSIKGSR